jgi:hypothetical protein
MKPEPIGAGSSWALPADDDRLENGLGQAERLLPFRCGAANHDGKDPVGRVKEGDPEASIRIDRQPA